MRLLFFRQAGFCIPSPPLFSSPLKPPPSSTSTTTQNSRDIARKFIRNPQMLSFIDAEVLCDMPFGGINCPVGGVSGIAKSLAIAIFTREVPSPPFVIEDTTGSAVCAALDSNDQDMVWHTTSELLSGSKDDQIHGTIHTKTYPRVMAIVQPQNILIIKHYEIKGYEGNYRAVPRQRRLQFIHFTEARIAVNGEEAIPRYHFTLLELEDMASKLGTIRDISDIMGKLVAAKLRARKSVTLLLKTAVWITITLYGDASRMLSDAMLSGDRSAKILFDNLDCLQGRPER